VSNDWVVRYDSRLFQIDRHSQRPPARAAVQVFEAMDGQVEIRSRDQRMRSHEIAAADVRARRTAPPRAD
jgi:hypothetical protein